MRRRHGIPDNDHRPFNVAYAAVLRSRQEGEERARRARLQELIQDQQSAPHDQDSRQRNDSVFSSWRDPYFLLQFSAGQVFHAVPHQSPINFLAVTTLQILPHLRMAGSVASTSTHISLMTFQEFIVC